MKVDMNRLQVANPPLLPYEKDLIRTLGCSEEEYRKLMRFALLKGGTRPAEYDHIPDIVNDPVTIIVSIVVGVALQAASACSLRDDPAPVQQENENTRVGQDPTI